jgi:hypothetical protein
MVVLECHGKRAPLTQGYSPVRIVDLDSAIADPIFTQPSHNRPPRADCFIIYRNMTAIMELKSSYPEKAIPQLIRTDSILQEKWSDFLTAFSLAGDTPHPSAYYFIAEKGIGNGRFEAFNGVLREKSRAGRGKGPVQTVNGIPITVYSSAQIENEYNLYGVK